MDNREVARELVKVAKALISADTFECPTCGTNVMEKTKYCVKCKKKVGSKRVAKPNRDMARKIEKAKKLILEVTSEMNMEEYEFEYGKLDDMVPKLNTVIRHLK